ncbi:MAG TPA: 4-(cytidine 5'-diphospho)-2-C-methyl-D-erythritol kinase [Lacipirellulaceae bacterium]|jgi:4-diphosphocytidyl-2-C-methyl-D-erythritol kinase
MILRQDESPWTVPAPAKLNLYLEVLGRRPDGYHELETLLVPIQLYDSLTFSTNRSASRGELAPISLDVTVQQSLPTGATAETPIPIGSENLVVRALELLRERSGCDRGAHVHLVKRIPAAAGLGGGSSDAAAALRLGNRDWGLGWSRDRLASLAAELGSDVPFFLSSGPAICRGRGERIEAITGTVPLHFVVVKPPIGLATPDVYRAWDDRSGAEQQDRDLGRASLAQLVAALRRGDFRNLGEWMSNRLQAAATQLSPWIDQVRTACTRLDFVTHQLTGSGSAYFGVCRHAQHARRLATILRTRQLGLIFTTQSCR